ncbi:hypothetical protein HG536_0C00710 [Torulaspora globosa]|uniref:Uncharacterized protein n=1 Tax=Torulaspora globosa TaxID=48254 RepID=A0A7G3ZEG8_9SACH|nr:uncharacterized protein HG536_0C00710 [Torulaspora globosa]QLL31904.1 hypothetical protein HG536_0C00710 [Torulaspora globosa]
MNSIYELDPKWRKLLTSSNFLGGLTVNEFVEELSKDHAVRGSSRNGNSTAFERLAPKPYIRTFEFILKELSSLSEEASEKKIRLAEQVSSQELQHAEDIIKLQSKLKNMIQKYENVDHQLTNVTQAVSPLGEKMEIAIRRKKVYIKSVELIVQYNAFCALGKSSYLESLRLSPNWRKKAQAAVIIKNLLALAQKVETSSIPKTVEVASAITKYSEMMETSLLESFNKAYRENNFSQLNEIALILNQFNGGVNVIQSFINQHAYFIDTKVIDNYETSQILLSDEFKAKLTNPDEHGVIYEKSMMDLIDDIVSVVKSESKVVQRVFEQRAPNVMQLFMQRIFAQRIEPKVDLLLKYTFPYSNLAYVRMLHALFTLVRRFTEELSKYFQLLEIDKNNVISATIEQNCSDLFAKYVYNSSRYFDIEKKSLESILFEKTSELNLRHDKEIRSRALVHKLNNSLENNLELQELTGTTRSKLSQLNNFFKSHIDADKLGINRNNSVNRSNSLNSNNTVRAAVSDSNRDLTDNDLDLFRLVDADSMLKCVVESIARVMELVPNKASSYSYELLKVMLTGIVSSYIETALEIAYSNVCRMDVAGASEKELFFLKYISISSEILSLLSASVKAIFLPILTNSPSTKNKITEITNNQIKRCELLINTILEDLIQVYLTKFKNCLAKQKKKDFYPKTQELLDHDTLPAVEIVSILNTLYSQAVLYLKSKNLESFLTKIGEGLYELLLSHYGKFQVSSTGGIIVTKDIIGYQTAIEEWGIPNLYEKFAILREMANLFTVQPDLLDSLTKEGHLAEMNKDIISAYISNREDFTHERFIAGVKLNLKQ